MGETDLHVHTTASVHAFSTLKEYVDRARDIGIKAIAITDHGPNLKGGPQSAYFTALCSVVPETIDGVRILKGIEANILDIDGTIDVPFHAKARLDLVLAYPHPFTAFRDSGKAANTKAIIAALERNPCIDILSHPLASWFETDVGEIARVACGLGVAMELNENTFRSHPVDLRKIACLVEETLSAKGVFVISSDSHHVSTLGADAHSREIVKNYGIPDASILNDSLSSVLEFIKRRKELKKR